MQEEQTGAQSSTTKTTPSSQTRVWLNVNFEEYEQFTSPSLVCQYCFRPIGLDKTLEALTNELRQKPLILPTSTHQTAPHLAIFVFYFHLPNFFTDICLGQNSSVGRILGKSSFAASNRS